MRELIKELEKVNEYSKFAVKLGALMMASFYITGIVSYIIAPVVPNYLGALSVFRSSMESAPASLASGVCAAVLCDLAVRK